MLESRGMHHCGWCWFEPIGSWWCRVGQLLSNGSPCSPLPPSHLGEWRAPGGLPSWGRTMEGPGGMGSGAVSCVAEHRPVLSFLSGLVSSMESRPLVPTMWLRQPAWMCGPGHTVVHSRQVSGPLVEAIAWHSFKAFPLGSFLKWLCQVSCRHSVSSSVLPPPFSNLPHLQSSAQDHPP